VYKRALITGITGQDGSYLAELLLDKDYEVHGIIRRASMFNTSRIDHLYEDPHVNDPRLTLHYGDLTDANALSKIMRLVKPDEVYNLAAQSHVRVSFHNPIYATEAGALGALKLLEAVREFQEHTGCSVRYYQASSSEQFGKVVEVPQSETTPFYPRSPYACAKVFAHHATVNYREAYGLYASCGILFNHESPRRGQEFVTRKITSAAARIKLGLGTELRLGNLDARRDWGFAGDYVEAMWLRLQQDETDDYVISTGETHSVREFCELCFAEVGLPLSWQGVGEEQTGCGPDGRVLVAVDPRYFRPAEVDLLLGDASKARDRLGWRPKVHLKQLAQMMVEADLAEAHAEAR